MNSNWLTIINEGDDVILDSCSNEAEGSVIIPEGVTKIEDYAFDSEGCNKITSISIPSTVKTIGVGAFNGCTNLRSIHVDTANTIYDSRDNCNAIIETATNTLIKGCQSTIVPDDVKSIGEFAFVSCSTLTSLDLPDGLEEIGVCALAGTGLTTIEFPRSLKHIDDNAFGDCLALRELYVPLGVRSINRDAFRNCKNLALIRLPESALPFEGYFAECPCKIEVYSES